MSHSNKIKSCWFKVAVKTEPCLVEALSDFLVGVTGAGVEILVDDRTAYTTINAFLEKRNPDELQQAQILAQIHEYAREMAEIFQAPVPEIHGSIIEEEDWGNTWKEHFKPFAIIPGLVIKPTWEAYSAEDDEQVIEMDPGMAFGTGHHATTTLSLELLQHAVAESGAASVLDVGTGTGILAMAAILFGATRAVGIDNDPDAVTAATENAHRNGLEERLAISSGPLTTLQGPFSIVVANIIHDVLVELADDLVRLVAGDGRLILSGILTGEQSENIIRQFSTRGFNLLKHLQKKEWSALLFEKPAVH